MPASIDVQIKSRIEEFAQELSRLAKQAAVDSVLAALGDSPMPRSRKPGRPRGSRRAKAMGRSRAAAGGGGAGKRIRRSTEDLEAMASKVLTHVKANAGARLEEISAGLRIASKELKRPVANLLEARKLRTEGQKRGTRYYAGHSGKAGGANPTRRKGRAGRKRKAQEKV